MENLQKPWMHFSGTAINNYVATFLKADTVSSENRPKPCITVYFGRLKTSLSSFYKYFAPLAQAPIKSFG